MVPLDHQVSLQFIHFPLQLDQLFFQALAGRRKVGYRNPQPGLQLIESSQCLDLRVVFGDHLAGNLLGLPLVTDFSVDFEHFASTLLSF